MEVTHRIENDICIMYVEGQITHSSVDPIKKSIESVLEKQPCKGILINCRDAEHIDSSGLGLVVFIDRLARKQGIKLHFCELKKRLMDLFLMSGLHTRVEVFPTEAVALESFFSTP